MNLAGKRLANERDPETGKPKNTVASITSTRWPGNLGSVEVSLADNGTAKNPGGADHRGGESIPNTHDSRGCYEINRNCEDRAHHDDGSNSALYHVGILP